MGRRWVRVAVVAVVGVLLACGGDDDTGDDDAGGDGDPAATGIDAVRDELLAMMDADQAERTGGTGSVGTDGQRTARLQEIVEEHGWPTISLVGDEAATAAWLIAQHSDFDVGLQEEFLALMRAAAEDDDVDPTEVAYLEDRVAVNNGEPQAYGTQVRCVAGGGVQPATPLVDEAGVDRLRAEVGLGPLADYFAEFEEGCAAEAP